LQNYLYTIFKQQKFILDKRLIFNKGSKKSVLNVINPEQENHIKTKPSKISALKATKKFYEKKTKIKQNKINRLIKIWNSIIKKISNNHESLSSNHAKIINDMHKSAIDLQHKYPNNKKIKTFIEKFNKSSIAKVAKTKQKLEIKELFKNGILIQKKFFKIIKKLIFNYVKSPSEKTIQEIIPNISKLKNQIRKNLEQLLKLGEKNYPSRDIFNRFTKKIDYFLSGYAGYGQERINNLKSFVDSYNTYIKLYNFNSKKLNTDKIYKICLHNKDKIRKNSFNILKRLLKEKKGFIGLNKNDIAKYKAKGINIKITTYLKNKCIEFIDNNNQLLYREIYKNKKVFKVLYKAKQIRAVYSYEKINGKFVKRMIKKYKNKKIISKKIYYKDGKTIRFYKEKIRTNKKDFNKEHKPITIQKRFYKNGQIKE